VTFLGLTLAAFLLLAGSAAAGSLPGVPLRFEERVLCGVVLTVLLGTALTFLLTLVVGLSAASALGGSAIFAAAAAAVAWSRRGRALEEWRESWRELTMPANSRHRAGVAAMAGLAAVLFGLLFAHSLGTDGAGNLNAGFQTVWADWSQHLTTANSFAVAHNLPPQNPLFSGQDLRYPFLPDFHSATLLVLGASPAIALALPGAVLAVCVTLLIVTLAVRLGAGLGAGGMAAAICFIGGGLGFAGILSDACLQHGFSASQCSWSGFFSHPVDMPAIIAGTLRELPGLIAAQPRAYDGLLTPSAGQPLPNQQWYTPLFAWWLPQRSLLYGFAGALVVLTLVMAAVRSAGRRWGTFAIGGLLLGLMPLIHIHTLIAMAVVLVVLGLCWRRREWLVLVAVTALVAGPRLITLLGGPHGSLQSGNLFPTVEPGWMYLGGGGNRPALGAGSLAGAVGGFALALVSPAYWGFWVANTGVALPVCVVVLVAALLSGVRGRVGAAGRRVVAIFPSDLLRVCLGLVAVFAVANVVVFQSWDWDNTKLLAYWYLGAALLVGNLVARWWRRRWRRVAAAAIATTVMLTGVLVLARLLPWTPAADAVGGPYTVAGVADIRVATAVEQATAPNAVFLTEGRPNDPLLTVAGRTSLLGYYGWLWSYGTDFGTRYNDVRTMLEGCSSTPRAQCPVFPLLRRYTVDYVEIDSRLTSPGVVDSRTSPGWWAAQGFPVVARSADITVYDVRGQ
jgi:hypothetical protein